MYTVLTPSNGPHAKAAPFSLTPGSGDGATIRPALVTSETEDFATPALAITRSSPGEESVNGSVIPLGARQ